MLLPILALLATLSAHVGSAPLPLTVRIRTEGYLGALCVTVDGPEFHRSCWVRQKADPIVRWTKFLLGSEGDYEVTLEYKDGTVRIGTVQVV